MLKLKQWLLLMAILAGVIATASLVPLHAARPGGGGGGGSVPAGTIYFTQYPASSDSTGVVFLGSMNTDGSGKQALPYQPFWYESAQLSNLTHQGHRWFLGHWFNLTTYHSEVFAVRDDGDPDYVVLLLEYPDRSAGEVRWGKSDELFSVVNRNRSVDGLAHIDAAGIEFDADGVPYLATPFIQVAEGEQAGYMDISNHDWSPSGDQVVYQQSGNPGPTSVKIADMVTGTTTTLFADNVAWRPIWSPDGSRIACEQYSGIYVVNPDGTGLLKVTSNPSTSDIPRGWSPDSQHILFTRTISKSVKNGVYEYSSDVRRVPATGGTTVNLTKDLDGDADAMYWR